jgi:hypothetical protein
MSYQLTTTTVILRLADAASIPSDPANADYQEYLAWLAAGGTPLPVDTTLEQTAAFAVSEDAERLAIIEARSADDPAFAALADMVLRGVSR